LQFKAAYAIILSLTPETAKKVPEALNLLAWGTFPTCRRIFYIQNSFRAYRKDCCQ